MGSSGIVHQTAELHLKFGLVTHCHYDHCAGMARFQRALPEMTLLGHRSQSHDPSLERWFGRGFQFDEVWNGDFLSLTLGGEPLHLIWAPKHSWTDLMVLFRGTAITGDWVLGSLRDCNALVPPTRKRDSIFTVSRAIRQLNYRVVRVFSGHANHLFHNVNFQALLEKSLTP